MAGFWLIGGAIYSKKEIYTNIYFLFQSRDDIGTSPCGAGDKWEILVTPYGQGVCSCPSGFLVDSTCSVSQIIYKKTVKDLMMI